MAAGRHADHAAEKQRIQVAAALGTAAARTRAKDFRSGQLTAHLMVCIVSHGVCSGNR